MSQHDAFVAVYEKHEAAEAAVRKIAEEGLDMKHFSIVGRGYHTDEKVIGFYSAGDRVKFGVVQYPLFLGYTRRAEAAGL